MNQRGALNAHDVIRICGMPATDTPVHDFMRKQLHLTDKQIQYVRNNFSNTVVHNIVMVARVSGGLLYPSLIKKYTQGSGYDQFSPHALIRWNMPRCTLLVFKKKIVIVGAKSEMAVTFVVNSLIRFVNDIYQYEGIDEHIELYGFIRSNMQAVTNCGVRLNLQNLSTVLDCSTFHSSIIKLMFIKAVVPVAPHYMSVPEVRKAIGVSINRHHDKQVRTRLTHAEGVENSMKEAEKDVEGTRKVTFNLGGLGKIVVTGPSTPFQVYMAVSLIAAAIVPFIEQCGEGKYDTSYYNNKKSITKEDVFGRQSRPKRKRHTAISDLEDVSYIKNE